MRVEKFSRSEAAACVVGDGLAKPRGVLNYPTSSAADATRPDGILQYVPTGDASSFASTNPADCLKTLMYSVRTPYRRGASWLMNSATAARIDKMKDGQGNYLWSSSMTAGSPSSLLGYPVEFSEDMLDIGANAYPIAFGNFNLGYLIVDMAGTRLYVTRTVQSRMC